jgi:hypothetical protein
VAQVAIDGMAKQYQLFEAELVEFKRKLKKLDATARAIATQGEKVFLDPTQYRARHPNSGPTAVSFKNMDVSAAQPWHNPRQSVASMASMALALAIAVASLSEPLLLA